MGSGHVELTWEGATDPFITGYHVYWGGESGMYTNLLRVAGQTNVTISGLEEGATYYFATTSFDVDGIESVFSAETRHYIPWATAAGSNWLADLNGTYTGLFHENEYQPARSGAVSITIGRKSAYSGRLRTGRFSRSFTGGLDEHGRGVNVIRLNQTTSLSLKFQLGSGDEQDLWSGEVSDTTWTAVLSGARQSFNARTNPAPCSGVYTMALANDSENTAAPEGFGYGLVRVSASGLVLFAGEMADGTKVAQAAGLSPNQLWPVYLALYGGTGSLLNWLAFTQHNNARDLVGSLKWTKPPVRNARYYPEGFATDSAVIGSVFLAPVSPMTPLLDPPQVAASFAGGNLPQDIAIAVELGASGNVRDLSDAGISMKFSQRTGLFQGRLTDPTSGGQWTFRGAVVSSANTGYGLMLGRDKSSRVMIRP